MDRGGWHVNRSERHTCRWTMNENIKTDVQYLCRCINRQTGRQAGKQTDRQTDRQIDRRTDLSDHEHSPRHDIWLGL